MKVDGRLSLSRLTWAPKNLDVTSPESFHRVLPQEVDQTTHQKKEHRVRQAGLSRFIV